MTARNKQPVQTAIRMASAIFARNRQDLTRVLVSYRTFSQRWAFRPRLVELLDDDRATLLGALLEVASWLQEDAALEEATDLKARWRRRGLRAFDADNATAGE